MRLFLAKDVRDMDRKAMEEHHTPGLLLMENAARGAVEVLLRELPSPQQSKPIAIFAGPGNNGGDGYAMARHLLNHGYKVWTFLCTQRTKIQGDAKANLLILETMTKQLYTMLSSSDWESWNERVGQSEVVIDALLGTGLSKPVQGWYYELLQHLNALTTPLKMAVDLPSGLHADSGFPNPVCFRADLTTTFAGCKVGLAMPSAHPFVGKLEVVGIGMPHSIFDNTPHTALLQDENDLKPLWPDHTTNSHKGTYGHALVLAGSPGKLGAALLTSQAILRMGAGLCTLANEQAVVASMEGRVLEVMTQALPPFDNNVSRVTQEFDTPEATIAATLRAAQGKTAVVIGPGLGQSPSREQWLASLLRELEQPVLVDADGLNLLASQVSLLKSRKAPTVLTPHPGEMGRLLGCSSKDVQANRLNLARDFAQQYKVTLVLKGARTVIASPSGECWLNSSGHAGLATAGSGDVLSGMIGALLARKIEPTLAARLGVYLHGKTADLLRSSHGKSGLIAGDLLAHLPTTLAQWETE